MQSTGIPAQIRESRDLYIPKSLLDTAVPNFEKHTDFLQFTNQSHSRHLLGPNLA